MSLFRREQKAEPLGLFRKENALDFLAVMIKQMLASRQVEQTLQIQVLLTGLPNLISSDQALAIITTLTEHRAEVHGIIDEIADEAAEWLEKNSKSTSAV